MRGLDYYTRSVWEVWPPVAGAQSTIGGGGRYDGLAEQLGGRPTPGVGFASGVERIILELKDQHSDVPTVSQPCAYLVFQNDLGKRAAFRVAESLRASGISADVASGDRKLGKQLSAADRAGACYAVILGDDELADNTVTVKDLRRGGEQRRVPAADLAALLRDGRVATE